MADANYKMVEMRLIEEPGEVLRAQIDPVRLGELADSMAVEGLHQPIGVRGPVEGGRYEVIWGHRRFLAARANRWDMIMSRVFPPDFDPHLARVSENLQRSDLTPIEEARAIQSFRDRGEPLAAIGRLFRRSDSWVLSRLDLLGIPQDLQVAVQLGAVSVAVARLLADIDNDDYRQQLINEAQQIGATARTVEVWRAHYLADRERIITNNIAVEQIIQERGKYVIHYPCDWCGDNHPYGDTRTWRLCTGCDAELQSARQTSDPTSLSPA